MVVQEEIVAEVGDHLEELKFLEKKLKALHPMILTIKGPEVEARIVVFIVEIVVVIVVIIVKVVVDIVDHKISRVLSTGTKILTKEESFRDSLVIRHLAKAAKVMRYKIMKSLIIRSLDTTKAKEKKDKIKKRSHQTVLLKEDLKLSRNVGMLDLHLIMRLEDPARQEELRLAAVVTTIMKEEEVLKNLILPEVAEEVTIKPIRFQSKFERRKRKKNFS